MRVRILNGAGEPSYMMSGAYLVTWNPELFATSAFPGHAYLPHALSPSCIF